MPGIELEDIMVGISIYRNQDLANVFYRLHLIEAYGTGMGKIMKVYEGMEEKPVIETTKMPLRSHSLISMRSSKLQGSPCQK